MGGVRGVQCVVGGLVIGLLVARALMLSARKRRRAMALDRALRHH